MVWGRSCRVQLTLHDRLRIIVSAGPYVWQDWGKCFVIPPCQYLTSKTVDVANSLSLSRRLPVGIPGAGAGASYLMSYRTDKLARILGLDFRTKADTARDVLTDFERLGW